MKVKFNLVKMEKALVFQIVEQENFRKSLLSSDACVLFTFYTTFSEIIIGSSEYPNITIFDGLLIINLRGTNKGRDNDIVIKKFKSNKVRDLIYDLILKSMDECFNKIEDENKI